MKFSHVLLAAILTVLFTIGPGDGVNRGMSSVEEPGPSQTIRPRLPEPPSALVAAGDAAPDFLYQSEDNRWWRLHDLLIQGPVVLVFGASGDRLRALEAERDALLHMGVLPVAVLDLKNGPTWATARRFTLRFPLIPDSRRVIAGQFNVVDAAGEHTVPAWFVLDRKGRVCSLKRGMLPERGFAPVVAGALGLPSPGSQVPIESR